ncbi:30S ribosomal protein S11 [Leptotrichia hofstadii]|uniref:Small ribosomal subunit protein uS11 n=6 Tax=Leptotrichia TaxID=32067 RepID=A0A510JPA0_9FUSO|nr:MULTISPECIES: 30S ribosomal protein S11 [Leptotrichia]ACV39869.1 ribosomal protein S11 [Leptotrichia buccalis C-1013-b]ERK55478.1 30S ribosomal protein S11 [Leptotrichia sp. oral taxon 879 str. F0557]ERL27173.1 30S ribosomal protein S11 [Leptotrichia sp. oral taxon 225 str. F0581]KXB69212.1 30S ribosomal protein S11 [Leptotrichia wadei]WLD74693.1 30S ribosomal protein S11 [Leptotrichia sp. HMT-225]
MAKRPATSKKKKLKNIPNGIAYIHSTFNNTVVTITDSEGKVVIWKSGGTSGFKGTKKGTPFAAQIAAEQAAQVAIENGMKQIEIKIKGPGSGREASIRSIQATGLEVTRIVDITPVPHNGARPPKKRRP